MLEMLFAVLIFSFALISLMVIASRGVVSTNTSRNQLIAEFLAEEGIEVGRNMRDANYINQRDWIQGNGLAQCENAPCDVSYPETADENPILIPCDGGSCVGQYLTENQGTYRPIGQTAGTETTFWREVLLLPSTTENQKILQSTVHWKERKLNRKHTVTTYVSNWQ